MRLARFISENIEPILMEWEGFARGVWPSPDPTPDVLRDHAAAILQAVVSDMEIHQSPQHRSDKSKGTTDGSGPLQRPSDLHGLERVQSGVSILMVISEYRALRASALRLWRASDPEPDLNDIDDITRFNESIDESLASAMRSFTKEVEHNRRLLRESEERFRVAQELSPNGFTILRPVRDERGRVIDFTWVYENPAIARLNGTDPAGVAGRRLLELFPKHADATFFETYRQVAESGNPSFLEAPFHDETGANPRWLRVAVVPNGQEIAVLAEDITERKEAAQHLAADLEAMKRLQRIGTIFFQESDLNIVLHEVLDAAIAITNADFGNVQLLDAASGGLRIAAQRGFPQWWLDFWNSTCEGRGCCGSALERGERVVVEDVEQDPIFAGTPALEVQLKAGVRSVQSTPLISLSGKPLGMFSTHYRTPRRPSRHELRLLDLLARQTADIIDRERSQTELESAKEAAVRANRAKDKFLATLSHELRTPLTPILAGSQLLIRREDLPAEAYPTIELIKRNVELEARLIDDLLDLSRVIHGKVQLSTSRIDIHQVIKNAVDICRPRLIEKSQALELHLNAEQTTVEGDLSRLQQSFWNLIINAVKFTEEYGRISIQTENQAGNVVVKVSDTGRGIDPALLPRLFAAFEQGVTDLSGGGLGLGLSITKGLIELHHGTITAFSQGVGKGSTFTVTLPASAETAAVEAEETSCHPCPGSKSILLVEDNEDTGLLMRTVLENGGHRVHLANNVASALETAGENNFDLLLCDIGLPDGSGLDVVSALRKSKAIDKAVAMTGYGMIEDVRRCTQAGFDTHLTKPVNIEELERLIAVL